MNLSQHLYQVVYLIFLDMELSFLNFQDLDNVKNLHITLSHHLDLLVHLVPLLMNVMINVLDLIFIFLLYLNQNPFHILLKIQFIYLCKLHYLYLTNHHNLILLLQIMHYRSLHLNLLYQILLYVILVLLKVMILQSFHFLLLIYKQIYAFLQHLS